MKLHSCKIVLQISVLFGLVWLVGCAGSQGLAGGQAA